MEMKEKPIVLELKNIAKSFGETKVLADVTLTIREGEFVTFLGSSGCGKTTILRIIAGLEYPDGGQVLLEGKDMENIGPEKRNVNMVFQNYALFPHMNVFQNIAYGLKIRGAGKEEIRRRVTEMLSLVRLDGYEERKPAAMSGGQRQRVAIARALINNPRVLLLDEPLGALDLQLRREMQLELKHLQKELGITFIYITHDQEEAINMSDRIVVLHSGTIEQVGTPSEIYDNPRTSYVAKFVGSANVLTGTVEEISEGSGGQYQAVLQHAAGRMNCRLEAAAAASGTALTERTSIKTGEPLTLAIRSENILIRREPETSYHEKVSLEGRIKEKSFAGGMLRIAVELTDGTEVVIRRHGINIEYAVGERVYLEWPAEAAVPVDMEEKRPADMEDRR